MHKKIIMAMGMAGFIMLSCVKVNYAMDYEATEALADAAAKDAEETAYSKLVKKDQILVMSAGEAVDAQSEGNGAEQSGQQADIVMENPTEAITEETTGSANELSRLSSAETQSVVRPLQVLGEITNTEMVLVPSKALDTKEITENETETQKEITAQTETELKPVVENELSTQPQTEAVQAQMQTETATQAQPQTEAVTQAAVQAQPQTEAVTQAATQAQPQTEAATQPQTEAAAEENVQKSVSQDNTAYLENLTLSQYDAATAASSRVISISQKDYDILCRIVEAEATGKDVLAKMLVANVVFNRVNSTSFPNTVESVVFQRNESRAQFSPLDDGRYYTVTITDGTIEAVNRVLMGEDYSMGALYFASIKVVDTTGCWASRHLTELYRYGGHVFFAR